MTSECTSEVIISEGAISELNWILAEYKRPLIVSDVVIYDKYGQIVENVVDADVIWSISPVFRKGLVKQYHDIDVIMGFGGGKSIDLAKMFAMEANLEWISVPTAASHDGIASDVASVMHDGYRYSEKCKNPKLILADLSIMATAPHLLTLSGIGDIVSKASSLAEWRLANEHAGEVLDEKVYAIVETALKAVMKDDRIGSLVKSMIDVGNAMTLFGSSRPCSGTEHAISHAMDRRMQSLHGLQVAFNTPLSIYFLELAGYTKHSASGIKTFLLERKMPVTLKELDMTRKMYLDDIHHALKIMEKRERYSVLSHCKTSDDDLTKAISEIGY
ncbi:MAG: iron-containing alcohol dehydrogenase [Candidatus Thorarchaeota archaeon]|jgi:glycerol-1-phosphate dehydrogenase [NAD(P)+]